MSITILQTPLNIAPVYRPLNIVLSSTESAQPKFRYIARVKNSADVLLAEYRIPNRPNDRGWFDPSRVLESKVGNNKPQVLTGIQKVADIFIDYKIDFIEEYESGGIIVTGAVQTITDKTAYNGVPNWTEFVGGLTDFINDWQTTRRIIKTDDPTKFQFGFITTYTATVPFIKNVVRKNYFANGSTTTVSSAVTFDGTVPSDRFLNYYSPVWAANEVRREIWLEDQTNTKVSSSIFLVNYCEEERTTPVPIYYLNQFGRYDLFTFYSPTEFNLSIEAREFERVLGSVGSSAYVYDLSQHRTGQYMTKHEDTMTVKSKWLTDEEMRAIIEMAKSPQAYAMIGGDLIPVNVQTRSIERMYGRKDGLFDTTVQIRVSQPNYSQRG